MIRSFDERCCVWRIWSCCLHLYITTHYYKPAKATTFVKSVQEIKKSNIRHQNNPCGTNHVLAERFYFRLPSFLIFIVDITKCKNQFKDNSALLTCIPCDNDMDFAELINNELICLDRWLKSNKISINAWKTKYMLFFSNENVEFRNNKIIFHDFLPTPRRGSHVKSDKTHTQSSRYTP